MRTGTNTDNIMVDMKQINVMVVDDDIYVRQALEALITRHPKTKLLKIASSIDEAIESLESLNEKDLPDVILLDIHFHGQNRNGIESIQDIRDVANNSKILVCSMNREQKYVLPAITSGADGFVWKNESGDGIISAIIKLAESRFVVTKSIAEMILGQAVKLDKYVEILKEKKEYKKLTEELKKTMYLYCYCGMSAKEISEEMNLSIHTVNSRIKTAYQLLEAKSRAEAFSRLVDRQG